MQSPYFHAWHTVSVQRFSPICPLNLLATLTLPDCELSLFPRTLQCWVSNHVSFHQDPFLQPNDRVSSFKPEMAVI